jgi:hypothetical protein
MRAMEPKLVGLAVREGTEAFRDVGQAACDGGIAFARRVRRYDPGRIPIASPAPALGAGSKKTAPKNGRTAITL